MRSRKFFTAATIVGATLTAAACGSSEPVGANRPVVVTATTVTHVPGPTAHHTDPTTTNSTATSTSLYDPPPPPAPKEIKNNLPKYSAGDVIHFTEGTIRLVLTEAKKVDPKVDPKRPVKLIRKDQKQSCKGLPQVLDGGDANTEPVVFCPGYGDFYVKTAAMEATGSTSSLKATYAVMYGAADYLLVLHKLNNKPGYRDCMVGYLAGRLETAGVIDSTIADTQLEQYAGDPSFYGMGYQNGKDACGV